MRPRISITGSVRPSVGRLVGRSVGDAFVKNKGNQYFRPNSQKESCNHVIIDDKVEFAQKWLQTSSIYKMICKKLNPPPRLLFRCVLASLYKGLSVRQSVGLSVGNAILFKIP